MTHITYTYVLFIFRKTVQVDKQKCLSSTNLDCLFTVDSSYIYPALYLGSTYRSMSDNSG